MKELSLHILDIAQNSITADATLVEIEIVEDTKKDILTITVKDNGKGMSEDFLKKVRDPFTTTRTTRPVGMGISLFESAAKSTGGNLDITSELGVGTTVTAEFVHSHIDRQPVGNMADTFLTIINTKPEIDYVYTHKFNGGEFTVDTREIKNVLMEVDITTPDVLVWLKENIEQSLNDIMGGKQ